MNNFNELSKEEKEEVVGGTGNPFIDGMVYDIAFRVLHHVVHYTLNPTEHQKELWYTHCPKCY